MTGTGSAMTSTPLSEQSPPTNFPGIVDGTMSPYLYIKEYGRIIVIKDSLGAVGIGIGFIDILYHNVTLPNVYRNKTLIWNTCCKRIK